MKIAQLSISQLKVFCKAMKLKPSDSNDKDCLIECVHESKVAERVVDDYLRHVEKNEKKLAQATAEAASQRDKNKLADKVVEVLVLRAGTFAKGSLEENVKVLLDVLDKEDSIPSDPKSVHERLLYRLASVYGKGTDNDFDANVNTLLKELEEEDKEDDDEDDNSDFDLRVLMSTSPQTVAATQAN